MRTQQSWERAKYLERQLVARGISSKRLRTYGYGLIVYDVEMADVVVAGPVRKRLTRAQLTRGLKELHRLTDSCKSLAGPDGRTVYTFWIRANGRILRRVTSVGVMAGTRRGLCVRNFIKKYRFPTSGEAVLTPTTLTVKFP